MEYEELGNFAQNSAVANRELDNTNRITQYHLQEQERGLAETQLEVDSIKEEIYHLLNQDKLKEINGKFVWVKLENQSERILSDWGVDRIMQTINFYINKNILLSNFDEVQIRRLMLKFIREINDLILLKYQLLFYRPTFEECKEIILKKLGDKKKMRMFSMEILGKIPDDKKEKEIENELLLEMETTLEKEMEKIEQEQRKEKLRDYGLIIAQLEVIVFSTLNRAYRGEERGSLRRHMNVSELVGRSPPTIKQNNGGFFGWGRK